MTNLIRKLHRRQHLAENVVFVDGISGCGKSMISPVLSSLQRGELWMLNHIFEYSIQGCTDNITVSVDPINAGNDLTICPSLPPFNLTGLPSGGIWNGINIINQNTGFYDPSNNIVVDLVTYSFNQCIDTVEINVVDTEVFEDTLFLCHNSSELF